MFMFMFMFMNGKRYEVWNGKGRDEEREEGGRWRGHTILANWTGIQTDQFAFKVGKSDYQSVSTFDTGSEDERPNGLTAMEMWTYLGPLLFNLWRRFTFQEPSHAKETYNYQLLRSLTRWQCSPNDIHATMSIPYCIGGEEESRKESGDETYLR
jgi:hypothetical protein